MINQTKLSLLVALAAIFVVSDGYAVLSRPAVERPVKIGERLEVSPLIQLARLLQNAGYGSRIEFVLVALEEMSAAYKAEAHAIDVSAAADRATRNHFARWRLATLEYARSLDQLGDSMRRTSNVEILIDPQNLLRLNIDDRPVIIAGPRIDEPQVLARRIVERFCRAKPCSRLTESGPPQTAADIAEVFATWSFEQGKFPTLQTRDGLHFSFRSAADLGDKKQACLTLIKELRVLSTNIRYSRTRNLGGLERDQGASTDRQQVATCGAQPGRRLRTAAASAAESRPAVARRRHSLAARQSRSTSHRP